MLDSQKGSSMELIMMFFVIVFIILLLIVGIRRERMLRTLIERNTTTINSTNAVLGYHKEDIRTLTLQMGRLLDELGYAWIQPHGPNLVKTTPRAEWEAARLPKKKRRVKK